MEDRFKSFFYHAVSKEHYFRRRGFPEYYNNCKEYEIQNSKKPIPALTVGICSRATEEALMKGDMKPSFKLCFFKNVSLY